MPLEFTDIDYIAITASIVGVVMMFFGYVALRQRRQWHDEARLRQSVKERQNTPPSLHPIIDTNICIGSLSCVKACPEGDILGLVDGRATLVEASHCIGHSKCAIECPVDAITLVFGTKEKGVDLPENDERYESSRKGVFIVGELGGMGLIKNAIRQGLEVIPHVKASLKGPAPAGVVDVAIVGAGPSGIAAAVACKEQGLSYRLLEQGDLGGTVAHYPRGKVVMSETVDVPFYGKFGRSLLSKEELLQSFRELMNAADVRAEEGVKVEGLDGQMGRFVVKTSRGNIAARTVVLATGLRGSPRKLGAPGEDLPKVVYRLIDPTEYDGKRVLVVGGGDSAVEAAIQLATESSAKVTISYRQDSYSRDKPRNRELIADLVAQNRVRALMSSSVTRLEPEKAVMKLSDGQEGVLKNDGVIVAIGGELPTTFLEKVGVSIKRYSEESKGGEEAVGFAAKDNRRLAAALFVLGSLILAGLLYVGEDYYFLEESERESHHLHEWLRPAGLWGHGVGIGATLFMLLNFLYVIRKRVSRFKGVAHIRTWLTFHMFVGIMSPVVIAFHAAFQSRNHLATGTWVTLAIVVGTGIFGRFLFGLVPASEGKLTELSRLRESFQRHRDYLEPILMETTNAGEVHKALDEITRPPPKMGLLGAFFYLPTRHTILLANANRVRHFFTMSEQFDIFKNELKALVRLRAQVAFYDVIKRMFRLWLAFHITLAIAVTALMSAHVAISLYLGYMWMFSPQ